MKRNRFFISIMLVFSILFSSTIAGFAEPASANDSADSIDCILADFYSQTLLAQKTAQKEAKSSSVSLQRELSEIRKNTVSKLVKAGYEAYEITSETYEHIEGMLSTSLCELGLNKDYSYIIVVGESPSSSNTKNTNSVEYEYNGQTYYLRQIRITASDDPNYVKVNSVRILNSRALSIIESTLNAAIEFYVSSIPYVQVVGTIASICGLRLVDFSTAGNSSIYFHGAAQYERVFMQVWNDSYNGWLNGSCVESVRVTSSTSGLYYDATTNSVLDVPSRAVTHTKYSTHYSQYAFRAEQAILFHLSPNTYYDHVGSVVFKKDGSTLLTLPENF